MFPRRLRSSVLSRWMIVMSLIAGALFSYGQIALGRSQQPDTPMPSVTEMTWPEGAELLAAQVFTLDEDDYQWRISLLTAGDEPGQPTETGRGVVVAMTGTLLLHVNDEDFVRLDAGAALTLHEEDEFTATSVEGDPVEYLVIELLPFAEDNTTEESNLVGPIDVAAGGYALVLLNLPADMTTDMAAEQVIDGALRPGVSIAYTEDGLPERLEAEEDYDRFIVALYPPAGISTLTPVVVPPTAVPTVPPPPTRVPVTPTTEASPTASATVPVAQTPIPTNTPMPTATSAPTMTPTATATATLAPTPTATSTPTPVPTPVPTNTPEPTETPEPTAGGLA